MNVTYHKSKAELTDIEIKRALNSCYIRDVDAWMKCSRLEQSNVIKQLYRVSNPKIITNLIFKQLTTTRDPTLANIFKGRRNGLKELLNQSVYADIFQKVAFSLWFSDSNRDSRITENLITAILELLKITKLELINEVTSILYISSIDLRNGPYWLIISIFEYLHSMRITAIDNHRHSIREKTPTYEYSTLQDNTSDKRFLLYLDDYIKTLREIHNYKPRIRTASSGVDKSDLCYLEGVLQLFLSDGRQDARYQDRMFITNYLPEITHLAAIGFDGPSDSNKVGGNSVRSKSSYFDGVFYRGFVDQIGSTITPSFMPAINLMRYHYESPRTPSWDYEQVNLYGLELLYSYINRSDINMIHLMNTFPKRVIPEQLIVPREFSGLTDDYIIRIGEMSDETISDSSVPSMMSILDFIIMWNSIDCDSAIVKRIMDGCRHRYIEALRRYTSMAPGEVPIEVSIKDLCDMIELDNKNFWCIDKRAYKLAAEIEDTLDTLDRDVLCTHNSSRDGKRSITINMFNRKTLLRIINRMTMSMYDKIGMKLRDLFILLEHKSLIRSVLDKYLLGVYHKNPYNTTDVELDKLFIYCDYNPVMDRTHIVNSLALAAIIYHSDRLSTDMDRALFVRKFYILSSAIDPEHYCTFLAMAGPIPSEPYALIMNDSSLGVSPHYERYKEHIKRTDNGEEGAPFYSYIGAGHKCKKINPGCITTDPIESIKRVLLSKSPLWPSISYDEYEALIRHLDLSREIYEQMAADLIPID